MLIKVYCAFAPEHKNVIHNTNRKKKKSSNEQQERIKRKKAKERVTDVIIQIPFPCKLT
jgi:hypothetical protein